MKRRKIRALIILTLISLVVVFSNKHSFFKNYAEAQTQDQDPPLGIEYNDTSKIYKFWNELDTYWVDSSSGIQITADYPNFWAHNLVCVRIYLGNWREFCGDNLPWTWFASTDNESYVNLTGISSFSTTIKGYNYSGTISLEYYLTSYDTEVRITPRYKNTGDPIPSSELKLRIHDINIDATPENDFIKLITSQGEEIYNLSKPLNLLYTQENLTQRMFYMFDNLTETWLEMRWNESYWLNGIENPMNFSLNILHDGAYNSIIEWVSSVSLQTNDEIVTHFYWADAPKQNLSQVSEIYDNLSNWWKQKKNEAFENGSEFYVYDINLSIVMQSDGSVRVSREVLNRMENATALNRFMIIAQRFGCFDYPKPDSFDTTFCPENETTISEVWYNLAKNELKLPKREDIDTWYAIPYLLVDNKTGNLTTYSIESYPSEDRLYRIARLKLPSVFQNEPYRHKVEFIVDFEYTGTSHCIEFPLPAFSNVTLNVTMLSPVVNYTLGNYPEFVLENYTTGNSLIAKIRPYPCCGIKNVTIQAAKVCS